MSGLALACASLGAEVTGSDRVPPASLERLRAAGVRVVVGHAAENVPDGVELVYSSAVKADNAERLRGRELGLREVRRGELLAELSRLRRCVAIAGSHGKTTTSAMTMYALRQAGVDAGYVIGAELRDGSPSAQWASGEWLVVETDESDRTFLELEPEIGVVTNIEPEHLSEYGSMEDLRGAFAAFMARARHVVIADERDAPKPRPRGTVTSFKVDHVRLDRTGVRFEWRGHQVRLRVPGEHNARNAAAALEACRLVGVEPAAAVHALQSFPGARRRIEPLGRTAAGARIYEDYACHPNTIRTSLAALRTVEPGRVVAVFEPILFSRTRTMARPLAEALADADLVAVLDVYPGSEAGQHHPGVSGRLIADAAREYLGDGLVTWLPTPEEAKAHLAATLRADEACVFMGVGPNPQRLARSLLSDGVG
jgi:UDP-N-acetylmuramate--alanine ligase